jgi:hypothetical protein
MADYQIEESHPVRDSRVIAASPSHMPTWVPAPDPASRHIGVNA